jgi:hypothetical protein
MIDGASATELTLVEISTFYDKLNLSQKVPNSSLFQFCDKFMTKKGSS